MLSHRYTLRFNLGAGKNFMKWKLTDKRTRKALYFDPNTTRFTMFDCKLVNQKATANKIHAGQHKAVCAWLEFNNYTTELSITPSRRAVEYNPRIAPHWRNARNENIDGMFYKTLTTKTNKVYPV